MLESAGQPDHDRGAGAGRLRLDPARLRTRAQRPALARPAIDGAQGQPVGAGGAPALERRRGGEAAARPRLLQLHLPLRAVGRRSAPRGGLDALSAGRHPRRGGCPSLEPLRHGGELPGSRQRQHHGHRADREPRGGRRRGRDCRRARRGRALHRTVRSCRRVRAPRRPRARRGAGGDGAGLRARRGMRQARRHPGAGRSRRPSLHGHGRHHRGRGQRPRRVPGGHPSACESASARTRAGETRA